MNGLTSKTLSDHFNKPHDIHIFETRFAKNNNLCLPHPRTNYTKKGFSYYKVLLLLLLILLLVSRTQMDVYMKVTQLIWR